MKKVLLILVFHYIANFVGNGTFVYGQSNLVTYTQSTYTFDDRTTGQYEYKAYMLMPFNCTDLSVYVGYIPSGARVWIYDGPDMFCPVLWENSASESSSPNIQSTGRSVYIVTYSSSPIVGISYRGKEVANIPPVVYDNPLGGNFNDGSGDNAYPNNFAGSFLVKPQNADCVKLRFGSFDVHSTDYLYIYDGENESGNFIGKFNNDKRPPSEIVSSSKSLFLRFSTQEWGQAQGWSVFYEVVNKGISLSENRSYVCIIVPQREYGKNEIVTATNGLLRQVEYFDGLGRPVQNISIKATEQGNDIVKIKDYVYGMVQEHDYLPYSEHDSWFGAFRQNAKQMQKQYYAGRYGDSQQSFDTYVFDGSPLFRLTEHAIAGENRKIGGGHTQKVIYKTNADEVTLWRVDAEWNLCFNGKYCPGTLRKTETVDEDGYVSEKYTNIVGQIVRMVKCGLITDYVYNESGNLCWVLPPLLEKSRLPSSSDLSRLAYSYKYDNQDIMVEKKLPGVAPVYYAYNDKDLMVAVQDGNLRNGNQWRYTRYDALCRPVEEGFIQKNSRELLMQAVLSSTGVDTPSGIEYTKVGFPRQEDCPEAYRFIFYDSYLYGGAEKKSVKELDDALQVEGLKTVEIVKDLEKKQSSTKTFDYDHKGRLKKWIQNGFLDDPSARIVISNNYSFSGLVTNTGASLSVFGNYDDYYKEYHYLDNGLLKSVSMTYSADYSDTLVSISYSDINQVAAKEFGSNTQKQSYKYTINGWLSQINNPDSQDADLFSMRIGYDNAINGIATSPLWNGNISAVYWRTFGKNAQSYSYSYNEKGNLYSASWMSPGDNTNRSLSEAYYDDNGNMTYSQEGPTCKSFLYDGNQLSKVWGLGKEADFRYDSNGNATYDGLRGLSIDYNITNLPRKISNEGLGKVTQYFYDWNGTKLLAQNSDGSGLYYVGDFLFEKNINGSVTMRSILHDDGKVEKTSEGVKFFYNLKDYLGNTRVVYSKLPTTYPANKEIAIEQAADYYPFGRLFENNNLNKNRYLYNGKELQEQTIVGSLSGWYDYGARFYDPEIGRWHSVDPSADEEGQEVVSPYCYVENNPISRNDPDGRIWGNIIGAVAGAVVEYGGQVAANVYEKGLSASAFTDNIDVGDIAIAAGEGFLTSGGSLIKNAVVKTTVTVGAEVARNYLDVKTSSDGSGKITVKTNDAATTVKNTAIGLTVGKVGDVAPAPKVKVVNVPTPKQSVKQARVEAKANGTTVNRQQRVAIANKAKQGQKTATTINKTVAKSPQNTVASGTSEELKRKTDEKI